jgi:hypothetical protein
VKVVRRLFRFSLTYLFSLELILEIDPIEGLIFQVLLRIPQLFYNGENKPPLFASPSWFYTMVWIRIRHANPDPANPDHYQFQANEKN